MGSILKERRDDGVPVTPHHGTTERGERGHQALHSVQGVSAAAVLRAENGQLLQSWLSTKS